MCYHNKFDKLPTNFGYEVNSKYEILEVHIATDGFGR